MGDYKYRRVLLKLSGEALMGNQGYGIDPEILTRLAHEIGAVSQAGVEIAIVVGGGNIFRGLSGSAKGMERSHADYIGMLATAMNALALQDAFERLGHQTRVLSAITMQQVAEPYIRRRAERHLQKGRIVIFACGTGNPYFTTDTAAALRACEIDADCLMKATKVDGIYTSDPKRDPDAQKYDEVSYDVVIAKNLKVMDATAIALCRENEMPIIVFNMERDGFIDRALKGEQVGTTVVARKE